MVRTKARNHPSKYAAGFQDGLNRAAKIQAQRGNAAFGRKVRWVRVGIAALSLLGMVEAASLFHRVVMP